MTRPVDKLVQLIGGKGPSRLHEIDIENMVGSGKPTKEAVQTFRHTYTAAVDFLKDDLIIIAAGPQNREAVFEGWPGAVYLFKKGTDGADEALVDFYHQIEDKSIFSDLFIASGDNKFASVVDSATQDGIRTTLVIGAGKKSWKLKAPRSINLEGGNGNG